MIKKYFGWFLLLSTNILSASSGVSTVYLSLIENNTGKTLYEVHIPSEKYTFLLPPNTKKNLGRWIDFHERPDIYLGVLKGAGEPIFLDWGPESSGDCPKNIFVQSFIYWSGEQNPASSDKMYLSCCLEENKVELGLKIHPDGKPELYVLKGATSVNKV